MSGGFWAGSASVNVTPDWPLANYNGQVLRPCQEPSPLEANVLVCRDGATSTAIVAIDCTFMDRGVVLRLREEVWRAIGVPPGNVTVAANHNHSTPATAVSFLSGALPDPLYLDLVVAAVAQAAEDAAANVRPAVLAAGSLHVEPIAHCRRRISPNGQSYMMPDAGADASGPPENEVDREMAYLAFETPRGEPIALVMAYPIHNNITFGWDEYHGDMFGRARQILRRTLGPGCAVLTLASPAGDLVWCGPDLKPTVPGNDVNERSWSAGQAIAAPVLAAYPTAVRRRVHEIVVHSVIERLPDRSFSRSDFCHDGCRGSDEATLKRIRRRYDPEQEAVRRRGKTWCNVEIQCVSFGYAAIVTNPGELFSNYGVAIKTESPFPVTLVAELTNGYCGYVPTVEAFSHKGYETHRTVYTSRLAEDSGDRIARMSVAVLSEAWNRDDRRGSNSETLAHTENVK